MSLESRSKAIWAQTRAGSVRRRSDVETGTDSGSQLHVLIAVGCEFDGELLPSALEGAKAFRATAVRDSEFLG